MLDVQYETSPLIGLGSARVRKSPFFEATRRWGAKAYTVYNHMYMPLWYESPEADFWHLVETVTLWDVGVERQVEIIGPDAARFVQLLTARDLSTMQVGQCKYALLCTDDGGVVNDPIILKLRENKFWISAADADVRLWALGILHSGRFDITIKEPDVSPLQLQGPRSLEVMRDLFGGWVDDLKYFWFRKTELDDIPLLVSRTGWSSERGYEIFLRDAEHGDRLWERIMEAGKPYGIAPAAPSTIRRIEGGMLSYGADMDLSTNALELGLDRIVDLDIEAEFMGKAALHRIRADGPKRKLVGLELGGLPLTAPNEEPWRAYVDGDPAGTLTSAVYSPRLEKNIALALLNVEFVETGTALVVRAPDGDRPGTVVPVPFYDAKKGLATGKVA
ncbi:MAG: glycine cleavage T C-terminal barrel domain-containing protein [Alphaproteobacteria bacterium]|nr:glycine cleavage T C-terminal barrel domain-containing protein [Alphaproteobacteria bacterium]